MCIRDRYFMHTVKSKESISSAYFDYGVRNFALDNKDELRKILEATNQSKDLNLFVRIAISNEHAEIDLSRKFGALTSEALGLVRLCKEYSKKLLELMERKSDEFPERKDDQSILEKIAKEGLGLTVFVSELEDACQSGIPEKIEREAARMQWGSDNGLGGFEALVEVALQDFERLGAFSFHLFRSNIFNRNIYFFHNLSSESILCCFTGFDKAS